jgi:hypothetical protein
MIVVGSGGVYVNECFYNEGGSELGPPSHQWMPPVVAYRSKRVSCGRHKENRERTVVENVPRVDDIQIVAPSAWITSIPALYFQILSLILEPTDLGQLCVSTFPVRVQGLPAGVSAWPRFPPSDAVAVSSDRNLVFDNFGREWS